MMSDIIEGYLKQRDIYYNNAEMLFKNKEYRKSSEVLWGAVTQTVKALAATSGIRIGKHPHFKKYLNALSKELHDTYYISEFIKIESLHRNFYDEELSPDELEIMFIDATKYMERLDELISLKNKEKDARAGGGKPTQIY